MRVNRIKLISLMAEKDMQINTLAEKSGLARATISAIRGGKSCKTETAAKLSRALGVSLEDIAED